MNARAVSRVGESMYSRFSTQRANLVSLLPDQDENNIARDLIGRSILHQLLDECSEQGARYIRLENS
jgi:hypothetical protein